MLVSIVIRTLNEQQHLYELLSVLNDQSRNEYKIEIVVIDSGSTDATISIAKSFNCSITNIAKDNFTFGRSLNVGSKYAQGDILVYVSGHCIPVSDMWLESLIKPIREGIAGYTYGRQIGRDTTKYSEHRVFDKHFPEYSSIPQDDFFCNNANAAIDRKIWWEYQFDEQITGLEDMELAKRFCDKGGKVAYVAEACVYHIHDESWGQTRLRYEREAIALQQIMPEIHVNFLDLILK